EPAPAGSKIAARLIGILEAKQTEDGESERNDRLIAVAEESHEHRDIRALADLNERLVQEIEHFFVSYNEMAGKQFKLPGRHGPHRAEKLVKQGAKRFREQHERGDGHAGSNGKQRAAKG